MAKTLQNIGETTKQAWNENWCSHDSGRLMEIFNYPRVKKQLGLYYPYLPKEKKILEGGCGLGPYVIYLAQQGYQMVGVDYNFSPLQKIVQFNSSLPISAMDVRKLAFKNGSFGAYLSLGVIEHFPEGPQKAIAEANRVLEINGYFIVNVPIMNIFLMLKYPFDLLKRNILVRKVFGKKEKIYYWQQYFKPKILKRLVEDGGFSVEKIVPMDHEHNLVAFSGIFRDKNSYDGANSLGLAFSRFCEKHFPWFTADNMTLICRKVKNYSNSI